MFEKIKISGPVNGPFFRSESDNLSELILQGIIDQSLIVMNNELESMAYDEFNESLFLEYLDISEWKAGVYYEAGDKVKYGNSYFIAFDKVVAEIPDPEDDFSLWTQIEEPDSVFVTGDKADYIHLATDVITNNSGEIVEMNPVYIGFSLKEEFIQDGDNYPFQCFVSWDEATKYLDNHPLNATYDSLKSKFITYTNKLLSRDFIGFL